MKRDPTDEVGGCLFEMARREPPPEGAEQRAIEAVRRVVSAKSARSQSSRRASAALLLFAAALGGALVIAGRERSDDSIGPERLSSAARAPKTHPSAPPERASLAPESSSAEPPTLASSNRIPRPRAPKPEPMVVADLSAEIALLNEAQSALGAGKSRSALEALDRYDRMKGQKMSAEATILRIEALSREGRSAEASGLARRFIEKNPSSPLVDRARSFMQQ